MSATAPSPTRVSAAAAEVLERALRTEDFVYGTAPDDFLVQAASRLSPNSRVLCIGGGEGRNSVWLAQRGHRVTALDVATQGIAKAAQLARRRFAIR